MRVYLKTYNLAKVVPDDDIIKWCRRNNFSTGRKCDDTSVGDGYLREQIGLCIKYKYGYLVLAHNGEKNVGWGLAYKSNGKGRKEFQCYVPYRFRRKGIGSKLLKKAINLIGRVKVYSHSHSEGFYLTNGLTRKGNITGKRLNKKV